MLKLVFWVGVLVAATSTIFFGLAMVALARFLARRRGGSRPAAQTSAPPPAPLAAGPAAAALPGSGPVPPVSLLKPLHGDEPGLEQHLESFFRLDYPVYEILFCARTEQDAGLRCARAVAARYPRVPVRFLTSGQPAWPNACCFSVAIMSRLAEHDLLVVTDSDVRVRPSFLADVVAPFRDPGVGAVTCVYRGAAEGMGLSAHLEGLGMSVEMTAGVLVADMLEGMRFTLGPAMIVRRAELKKIGGFERLGHYLAHDFMLGNLIAAGGSKVVLSTHAIDHCIVNDRLGKNLSHQLNWMKSTRFSRPLGHLGTVLSFAMPFGLLAALAGPGAGHAAAGLGVLGWAYASRVLLSALVGGLAVADGDAVRLAWIYPLRDLMGFLFWVGSYLGAEVGWREDRFALEKGGRMRPIRPAPADSRPLGGAGRSQTPGGPARPAVPGGAFPIPAAGGRPARRAAGQNPAPGTLPAPLPGPLPSSLTGAADGGVLAAQRSSGRSV